MAKLPDIMDLGGARLSRPVRAVAPISGDAASAPAAAMGQFGGVVSKIGYDIEDREATAAAKERDAYVADQIRALLHDPESGFLGKAGKGAVDARGAALNRLEAIEREATAGLSPLAKRKMEDMLRRRSESAKDRIDGHTSGARTTWLNDASNARIEAATADAAYDPAEIGRQMPVIISELRGRAVREGWSAERLAVETESRLSTLHKTAVIRIAEDDPIAAERYLAEHKDAISSADAFEMRRMLKPAVKEARARALATDLLSSGRAIAGRTVGESGPTAIRARLMARTPRADAAAHVEGLDEGFATALSALFDDAPPEIREGFQIGSGFRSVERQRELWEGSDKTGRMVARPGYSQHNHGRAVDIHWNGQRLDKAPEHVRKWVHDNAASYGLYFPMDYEPWHVEPEGSRSGGATLAMRGGSPGPRVGMPSYDQIADVMAGIEDPDVAEMFIRRVNAQMALQAKIAGEQQAAVSSEFWRLIDSGMTPDEVPAELRLAVGMTAVSSAYEFVAKRAKAGEIVSDPVLVGDLHRLAAVDPEAFSRIDFDTLRSQLSSGDIAEFMKEQADYLRGDREARESGTVYKMAYGVADDVKPGIGINASAAGMSRRERIEAERKSREFDGAVYREVRAFIGTNGRNPNFEEVTAMVNKLALPVILLPTAEAPARHASSTGFYFEAGGIGWLSDEAFSRVHVDYDAIPAGDRMRIERFFISAHGRAPTQGEVERQYGLYLAQEAGAREHPPQIGSTQPYEGMDEMFQPLPMGADSGLPSSEAAVAAGMTAPETSLPPDETIPREDAAWMSPRTPSRPGADDALAVPAGEDSVSAPAQVTLRAGEADRAPDVPDMSVDGVRAMLGADSRVVRSIERLLSGKAPEADRQRLADEAINSLLALPRTQEVEALLQRLRAIREGDEP